MNQLMRIHEFRVRSDAAVELLKTERLLPLPTLVPPVQGPAGKPMLIQPLDSIGEITWTWDDDVRTVLLHTKELGEPTKDTRLEALHVVSGVLRWDARSVSDHARFRELFERGEDAQFHSTPQSYLKTGDEVWQQDGLVERRQIISKGLTVVAHPFQLGEGFFEFSAAFESCPGLLLTDRKRAVAQTTQVLGDDARYYYPLVLTSVTLKLLSTTGPAVGSDDKVRQVRERLVQTYQGQFGHLTVPDENNGAVTFVDQSGNRLTIGSNDVVFTNGLCPKLRNLYDKYLLAFQQVGDVAAGRKPVFAPRPDLLRKTGEAAQPP
jgi:hypothetical protein